MSKEQGKYTIINNGSIMQISDLEITISSQGILIENKTLCTQTCMFGSTAITISKNRDHFMVTDIHKKISERNEFGNFTFTHKDGLRVKMSLD